jgi:hypothetical protein
MRFKDGRPSASSTPSRTQTFVVSTTLDLTSLRKFSFSIEEADMEVLLAMPTLCRVRSISALAENLKNGAQGRNRTTDTCIFSAVLYRLSYLGFSWSLFAFFFGAPL